MAIRCIQQIYDPRPKAEGFINGKLPMIEDEGRIFVAYAKVAMVHMIYIMKKSY